MIPKRSWFVVFICVLFLGGLAFAQGNAKPLTNDDVATLVKNGLPEGTIINAIGVQDTKFDVSATAPIKLKQQGVNSKILDAMLAASKKQSSAPAAAPADTGPDRSASDSVPPLYRIPSAGVLTRPEAAHYRYLRPEAAAPCRKEMSLLGIGDVLDDCPSKEQDCHIQRGQLTLKRLALALLLLGLAFSQTSTVEVHLDEVSKVKCMGEVPKDFVEP